MPFAVFWTDAGARDLDDIYNFIDLHDVPGKADYFFHQIS
jgi:hypothetical protein